MPALPLLQLANVLNNEQLFYTCIFPFIAFFGAFAFIMYPMRDILHPTGAWAAVAGLRELCFLMDLSVELRGLAFFPGSAGCSSAACD